MCKEKRKKKDQHFSVPGRILVNWVVSEAAISNIYIDVLKSDYIEHNNNVSPYYTVSSSPHKQWLLLTHCTNGKGLGARKRCTSTHTIAVRLEAVCHKTIFNQI